MAGVRRKGRAERGGNTEDETEREGFKETQVFQSDWRPGDAMATAGMTG